MSALDKIKKQGNRGAKGLFVDVPEWENMRIHYRKVTLDDAAEAMRRAKDNQVRQNVEMFVMIAQEEDGSPMFEQLDTLEIMTGADPEVIGRVMMEMGIIRTTAPGDAAKN